MTPPTDEEWIAYLGACAAMGKRMEACLVLADTPLTARQRKGSADVVKQAGTRGVAVVNTSAYRVPIETGCSSPRA